MGDDELLALEDGVRIELDRTSYALKFELAMLQLENLTPHQSKKLEECEGKHRVHVKGPAGGGKTYVALHKIKKALRSGGGTAAIGITSSDFPKIVNSSKLKHQEAVGFC